MLSSMNACRRFCASDGPTGRWPVQSQFDVKRPTRRSATPDFPEVWIWEVCFRQSLGFLPSGGQYTSKAPGSRYLGRARLARPAPCPAICGIEKDDGRIKRLCRWAPRQHSMDNPEKNRVAKAVVDRWCSFQEALCGTKRKYPTREF